MTDEDLDAVVSALPSTTAEEIDGWLATLAGLERFLEVVGSGRDGVLLLDPYRYDPAVESLVRWLYDRGLVVVGFAWADWDEGRRLQPSDLAGCPVRDAVKMLTAVVRNDRFCAGALGGALESGMVQACLARLGDHLGGDGARGVGA